MRGSAEGGLTPAEVCVPTPGGAGCIAWAIGFNAETSVWVMNEVSVVDKRLDPGGTVDARVEGAGARFNWGR